MISGSIFLNPYLKTDGASLIILFSVKDPKKVSIHAPNSNLE